MYLKKLKEKLSKKKKMKKKKKKSELVGGMTDADWNKWQMNRYRNAGKSAPSDSTKKKY